MERNDCKRRRFLNRCISEDSSGTQVFLSRSRSRIMKENSGKTKEKKLINEEELRNDRVKRD